MSENNTTKKSGCHTLQIVKFNSYNGDFNESYARDFSWELNRRLTNIPVLMDIFKYGYEYLTPVVITDEDTEEYVTEKGWFSKGGEKKKRVIGSLVSLKFPRELTEDELKFWRWFKLGYLCKYYRPNV